MRIRNATNGDLPEIRKIYNAAKAYMDASGNPNQWAVGYPPQEYLRQDIELSRLYVCEEDESLCGVFMLSMEADPTYHYIEGESIPMQITKPCSIWWRNTVSNDAVSFIWETEAHESHISWKRNKISERKAHRKGVLFLGSILSEKRMYDIIFGNKFCF